MEGASYNCMHACANDKVPSSASSNDVAVITSPLPPLPSSSSFSTLPPSLPSPAPPNTSDSDSAAAAVIKSSSSITKEMIEQKRLAAVAELARRRALASIISDGNDNSNSNCNSSCSSIIKSGYIPSNITLPFDGGIGHGDSNSNSNSNSGSSNNSNSYKSNISGDGYAPNSLNTDENKSYSNINSGCNSVGCQALVVGKDGVKLVQCGSMNLDAIMRNDFGEMVCVACRNSSTDYDIMTKTQVQKEYLISTENFLFLKFVCRDNPKNKHWTQMKMYLRKPCKEMAIKRFGSLELLQEECRKRERLAFEKESSNINEAMGFHTTSQSEEHQSKKRKMAANAKKIDNLLSCLE